MKKVKEIKIYYTDGSCLTIRDIKEGQQITVE